MKRRIIRLCYRKIIDASAQKPWDRYVFESSYAEFLMQAQLYNSGKKYTTFAELVSHVPGAEQLHFLTSTAVTGYLQQLQEKVPDIVNNLGKRFLRFTNFRFEIINSDITAPEAHQVAINFYTEPLVWHDTLNDCLLVSPLTGESTEDGVLTELVQLQPFLSIYSLKEDSV